MHFNDRSDNPARSGIVLLADAGESSKIEKLPTGAVRVRADVARTGIQEYEPWKGSPVQGRKVRIFRPAEEVFSEDSLATLGAWVPITVGHPPEKSVEPATWKKYSVGQLEGGEPERVSKDGAEFVRVSMLVLDGDTIEDLGESLVEVSQGYACVLDWTPGEHEGEPYDAVQRRIVHNHSALLAGGHARAGGGARILLDSNEEGKNTMTPEEVKALLAELLPAAIAEALKAREQESLDKKAKDEGAPPEEKPPEEKPDAEVKVDAKEIAKTAADAAKAVLEAAENLAAARETTKIALGDSYDAKGKTEAQILVDAITKVFPKKKLVTIDSPIEAIRAAWETIVQTMPSEYIRDSKKVEKPEEPNGRKTFFDSAAKSFADSFGKVSG